jgi:hypothetical protein
MLQPEPYPEVRHDETVTRHCRDSGHMRSEKKMGHYKAFMPPTNKHLSVVRSQGLSVGEIEQVGRQHVNLAVKGHATVTVAIVAGRELSVQPHPYPHARHANVVGWSDHDEVNRLHARALADASVLTVY